MGIIISPRPPSERGVFTQARWLYRESQLAAMTAVLISANSAWRSPKAMISVGQTNLAHEDVGRGVQSLSDVVRIHQVHQSTESNMFRSWKHSLKWWMEWSSNCRIQYLVKYHFNLTWNLEDTRRKPPIFLCSQREKPHQAPCLEEERRLWKEAPAPECLEEAYWILLPSVSLFSVLSRSLIYLWSLCLKWKYVQAGRFLSLCWWELSLRNLIRFTYDCIKSPLLTTYYLL